MTDLIDRRMQPMPLKPGDIVFICPIGGAAPTLMIDVVPLAGPRALTACHPRWPFDPPPVAHNDNEARP